MSVSLAMHGQSFGSVKTHGTETVVTPSPTSDLKVFCLQKCDCAPGTGLQEKTRCLNVVFANYF